MLFEFAYYSDYTHDVWKKMFYLNVHIIFFVLEHNITIVKFQWSGVYIDIRYII